MGIVCPTVTASTVEEYSEQLETVTAFANRIHIDLADGVFAKKSVDLNDISIPAMKEVDIHLMFKRPNAVLPGLVALQPSLVIIHAESEGDLRGFAEHLKQHNIAFGVSLLQKTLVEDVAELITIADHVLIFSGTLGSFGGTVDSTLLKKINQIRSINQNSEIGWDGGIQTENISKLSHSGIDVLNVGGAIQKANRPENAFHTLVHLASN